MDWWYSSQCLVRAAAMVVIAPSGKSLLDIFQAAEKVAIEDVFPNCPFESFDVAILIWLAGLDVIDVDLELLGPAFERVGIEHRSIGVADAAGFDSIPKDVLQCFY